MRSLPDIYKAPLFYVYVEDTVLIPDAPEKEDIPEEEDFSDEGFPEDGTEEESEEEFPESDEPAVEEGADNGQGLATDNRERRQGDRRKSGRRAEDAENLDNLVQLYRERLALTKEELYEEIGPALQDELQLQVSKHQSELQRRITEHEQTLQQETVAHEAELGRKAEEYEAELQRKMAEHEQEMQRELTAHQEELHQKIVEHKQAQQRQLDNHQTELQQQVLEARKEAYFDELQKKQEMLKETVDFVERGIAGLEQGYSDFIRDFTQELKYMALDIAERILNKEINEDIHALDQLVLQQVSEIKNASWINVEISDRISGLAGHLKAQLERAEQGKQFFIDAKDVPQDTCRIVTEEGVVDATLSVQLRQLREAFVRADEEGD